MTGVLSHTWLRIVRIRGNNDRLIAPRADNARCAPLPMDVLYEHACTNVHTRVQKSRRESEYSHEVSDEQRRYGWWLYE